MALKKGKGMVHRLYGWRVSYFTAKLSCYLNYKQIPYEEKYMNAFDLYHTAKKKVGTPVMPILVTPKGEWLQDTKDIIDEMEKRYPEHSVYPKTPCKKFVSLVLETWADEFWVPHAMHYRWNRPESVTFFLAEAGQNLLPYFPSFIRDYASSIVKQTLVGFLPSVGVRPAQYVIVEEWTVDMLNKLDSHFEAHPYLLGETPSIGDFALAGPLVAHLGRDPWPKEHLISKTPHVRQWIERISTLSYKDVPGADSDNDDDEIPATLMPMLRAISQEFLPMISETIPPVEELSKDPKFSTGRPLPRTLHDITFPMHNASYSRSAIPFHLWKVQNIIDRVAQDSDEDKRRLDVWLDQVAGDFNGKEILKMKFPRLERVGVRVKIQQSGERQQK
jgi:glutathione S-transferase